MGSNSDTLTARSILEDIRKQYPDQYVVLTPLIACVNTDVQINSERSAFLRAMVDDLIADIDLHNRSMRRVRIAQIAALVNTWTPCP